MNAISLIKLAGIVLFTALILPGQLNAQRKKGNIIPQKKEVQAIIVVNGYGKDVSGEKMNSQSCHPDANSALVVRCDNATQKIEWVTGSAPEGADPVTFAWIAGYSSGSSKSDHTFHVFVNDKEYFSFVTPAGGKSGDWSVKGPEDTELRFKFGKADGLKDQFGYMYLQIPRKLLNADRKVKVSVKSDASGTRDWFMTFRYNCSEKVTFYPEEVIQSIDGKHFQRVKVGLDHFSAPTDFTMTSEGKSIACGKIELGINYFNLPFERVTSPVGKKIKLTIDGKTQEYPFTLNPVKEYTVYLLPHSHVDIGYTELQSHVLEKQIKNLDGAIELCEKTANYPDDARFHWNTEVLWGVDGYLKQATPEKKKRFFDAVKKGYIGLDGMYGNLLLGLCRPEELYHAFEFANILEKEGGVKIETAMISDVPGYSWGVVPAMVQNGIKYLSIGPNPLFRIGYTLSEWGDKPFYWTSPSGKEKLLFWMSSRGYASLHSGTLVETDGGSILSLLKELNEKNYPYDMVMLRCTIGGDNGYPDGGISDYVKSWNEKYISPHLIISLAEPMFKAFEAKYAKIIPSYSGDFTPYWEDGAGSSALETTMNRKTAERLVQNEILGSLINPAGFPMENIDEAWKNVLLYSEHTWGAHNSISEPEIKFVKDLWNIKRSFAVKADSLSLVAMYDILKSVTVEQPKLSNFSVINTNSWVRTELVILPANWGITSEKINIGVKDSKGVFSELQKMADGSWAFLAKNIPAMSSVQYTLRKVVKAGSNTLSASGNTISNETYSIQIDSETGDISTLTVKKDNRNLASGKGLNGYVYTGTDAQNPLSNGKPIISISENGPVMVALKIVSDAPGCHKLTREVRLIKGLDRVEIINTIDKENVYAKENVRFVFPFNVKDATTRMDMAWTVVRPELDQLKGANKNYFTVQRYVDVSDNVNGITLATPDAPLLEVGGMNGEDWIKGSGQSWSTKTTSSSLLYSWVMNNSWFTNYKASQEGPTMFRYALQSHAQFDATSAQRFGTEFSQPLLVVKGAGKQITPLITVNSESGVIVSSIRPARDGKGWIVRLFNSSDKVTSTILQWPKGKILNLFASSQKEETGSSVQPIMKFVPYEIQTIKVME